MAYETVGQQIIDGTGELRENLGELARSNSDLEDAYRYASSSTKQDRPMGVQKATLGTLDYMHDFGKGVEALTSRLNQGGKGVGSGLNEIVDQLSNTARGLQHGGKQVQNSYQTLARDLGIIQEGRIGAPREGKAGVDYPMSTKAPESGDRPTLRKEWDGPAYGEKFGARLDRLGSGTLNMVEKFQREVSRPGITPQQNTMALDGLVQGLQGVALEMNRNVRMSERMLGVWGDDGQGVSRQNQGRGGGRGGGGGSGGGKPNANAWTRQLLNTVDNVISSAMYPAIEQFVMKPMQTGMMSSEVMPGFIPSAALIQQPFSVMSGYLNQMGSDVQMIETERKALKSVTGSSQASQDMIEHAVKIARTEPVEFGTALQAFRSFSVFPGTREQVKTDPAFREELLDVIQRLAILTPEQGEKGAMFALRELLSGQERSLKRRFNIDMPTIFNAAGKPNMSKGEFLGLSGDDMIGVLSKAMKKITGESALVEKSLTTTVQTNDIRDTLMQAMALPFNRAGIGVSMRTQEQQQADVQVLYERNKRMFGSSLTDEESMARAVKEAQIASASPIGAMSSGLRGTNDLLGRMLEGSDLGGSIATSIANNITKPLVDTVNDPALQGTTSEFIGLIKKMSTGVAKVADDLGDNKDIGGLMKAMTTSAIEVVSKVAAPAAARGLALGTSVMADTMFSPQGLQAVLTGGVDSGSISGLMSPSMGAMAPLMAYGVAKMMMGGGKEQYTYNQETGVTSVSRLKDRDGKMVRVREDLKSDSFFSRRDRDGQLRERGGIRAAGSRLLGHEFQKGWHLPQMMLGGMSLMGGMRGLSEGGDMGLTATSLVELGIGAMMLKSVVPESAASNYAETKSKAGPAARERFREIRRLRYPVQPTMSPLSQGEIRDYQTQRSVEDEKKATRNQAKNARLEASRAARASRAAILAAEIGIQAGSLKGTPLQPTAPPVVKPPIPGRMALMSAGAGALGATAAPFLLPAAVLGVGGYLVHSQAKHRNKQINEAEKSLFDQIETTKGLTDEERDKYRIRGEKERQGASMVNWGMGAMVAGGAAAAYGGPVGWGVGGLLAGTGAVVAGFGSHRQNAGRDESRLAAKKLTALDSIYRMQENANTIDIDLETEGDIASLAQSLGKNIKKDPKGWAGAIKTERQMRYLKQGGSYGAWGDEVIGEEDETAFRYVEGNKGWLSPLDGVATSIKEAKLGTDNEKELAAFDERLQSIQNYYDSGIKLVGNKTLKAAVELDGGDLLQEALDAAGMVEQNKSLLLKANKKRDQILLDTEGDTVAEKKTQMERNEEEKKKAVRPRGQNMDMVTSSGPTTAEYTTSEIGVKEARALVASSEESATKTFDVLKEQLNKGDKSYSDDKIKSMIKDFGVMSDALQKGRGGINQFTGSIIQFADTSSEVGRNMIRTTKGLSSLETSSLVDLMPQLSTISSSRFVGKEGKYGKYFGPRKNIEKIMEDEFSLDITNFKTSAGGYTNKLQSLGKQFAELETERETKLLSTGSYIGSNFRDGAGRFKSTFEMESSYELQKASLQAQANMGRPGAIYMNEAHEKVNEYLMKIKDPAERMEKTQKYKQMGVLINPDVHNLNLKEMVESDLFAGGFDPADVGLDKVRKPQNIKLATELGHTKPQRVLEAVDADSPVIGRLDYSMQDESTGRVLGWDAAEYKRLTDAYPELSKSYYGKNREATRTDNIDILRKHTKSDVLSIADEVGGSVSSMQALIKQLSTSAGVMKFARSATAENLSPEGSDALGRIFSANTSISQMEQAEAQGLTRWFQPRGDFATGSNRRLGRDFYLDKDGNEVDVNEGLVTEGWVARADEEGKTTRGNVPASIELGEESRRSKNFRNKKGNLVIDGVEQVDTYRPALQDDKGVWQQNPNWTGAAYKEQAPIQRTVTPRTVTSEPTSYSDEAGGPSSNAIRVVGTASNMPTTIVGEPIIPNLPEPTTPRPTVTSKLIIDPMDFKPIENLAREVKDIFGRVIVPITEGEKKKATTIYTDELGDPTGNAIGVIGSMGTAETTIVGGPGMPVVDPVDPVEDPIRFTKPIQDSIGPVITPITEEEKKRATTVVPPDRTGKAFGKLAPVIEAVISSLEKLSKLPTPVEPLIGGKQTPYKPQPPVSSKGFIAGLEKKLDGLLEPEIERRTVIHQRPAWADKVAGKVTKPSAKAIYTLGSELLKDRSVDSYNQPSGEWRDDLKFSGAFNEYTMNQHGTLFDQMIDPFEDYTRGSLGMPGDRIQRRADNHTIVETPGGLIIDQQTDMNKAFTPYLDDRDASSYQQDGHTVTTSKGGLVIDQMTDANAEFTDITAGTPRTDYLIPRGELTNREPASLFQKERMSIRQEPVGQNKKEDNIPASPGDDGSTKRATDNETLSISMEDLNDKVVGLAGSVNTLIDIVNGSIT